MVDWKKEIKLSDLVRRKDAAAEAPAEARVEHAQPEVDAPADDETPFWKKEISFSRKKEPNPAKQPKVKAEKPVKAKPERKSSGD